MKTVEKETSYFLGLFLRYPTFGPGNEATGTEDGGIQRELFSQRFSAVLADVQHSGVEQINSRGYHYNYDDERKNGWTMSHKRAETFTRI